MARNPDFKAPYVPSDEQGNPMRKSRKPSLRDLKRIAASLQRQIRKETRKREMIKSIDHLSMRLTDLRNGQDPNGY